MERKINREKDNEIERYIDRKIYREREIERFLDRNIEIKTLR